MAVLFVSHASAGAELAAWATDLPRPRSILVISSRWRTATLTRGSTGSHPSSQALKPAPELACDLHAIVEVARDPAQRLDPGASAALAQMFPGADVPVLQLSVPCGATPSRLHEVGRQLGPLVNRGTMLLAIGGITGDDRGSVDPRRSAAFDTLVANLLADGEIEELMAYRRKSPDAGLIHPTSEHIDPLFLATGAASVHDHAVGFPLRGFAGSASTRCVQFGRAP